MKKSKRFKQSYLDTYTSSWCITNMWTIVQHAKRKPILNWAINNSI